MGKLIATAMMSLDGCTADADGVFEWAAPDDEVLAYLNERERPIGTYLYGRRLYDMLVYWETAEPDGPAERDFADLWRAADKVVYSTTMDTPASARTRLERTFDPAAVRAMKDAAERDLSIGGAELAGQAFRAGLVDEVRLYVNPLVVGGGTRFLPAGARAGLRLYEEHRFGNGVVYLAYRVDHG